MFRPKDHEGWLSEFVFQHSAKIISVGIYWKVWGSFNIDPYPRRAAGNVPAIAVQ